MYFVAIAAAVIGLMAYSSGSPFLGGMIIGCALWLAYLDGCNGGRRGL